MQVILTDEQIQQIRTLIFELIHQEIQNILTNSNIDSPFLNKKQACDYLNISNNTLDKWIEKGLPFLKINKTIRFNKYEINQWLLNQ